MLIHLKRGYRADSYSGERDEWVLMSIRVIKVGSNSPLPVFYTAFNIHILVRYLVTRFRLVFRSIPRRRRDI